MHSLELALPGRVGEANDQQQQISFKSLLQG